MLPSAVVDDFAAARIRRKKINGLINEYSRAG
jgi:hypothetical protein